MFPNSKDAKLILAPMAGITDLPFRRICLDYGVDLVVTEMVSARGLIEGSEKSFKLMSMNGENTRTGIQLFGNDPIVMAKAAKIVSEYRPAFIDINAGCPAKKVVKSGSGGGLLRDLDRLANVLKAVIESSDVPVTCKTRIGFDGDYSHEIIGVIYDAGIRKIAIHGRTVKMGFKGRATYDWCKHMKNFPDVKFVLNGDIDSPSRAVELNRLFPQSDIMIGRAALGNPFIFGEIKTVFEDRELEKINFAKWFETIKKHYRLMLEYYGQYGLILMRKHMGWYLKGMKNSKKIKDFIFHSNDYDEIMEILSGYDRIT